MNRRDTFSIERNQRADVFCTGGPLRLIADHPLNALLIGVCSKAAFVRATELAVEQGDKTVVVKVERTIVHPVLKKIVRQSKKYHAHDEANAYKAGEAIRIIECAPKSKLKTWEVLPKASA